MSDFAETLQIARLKKRLTQSQLAFIADLTNVTISNLETGVHRPNDQTKAKIEEVLGKVDWERTYDEAGIKRHISTN